MIQLCRQRLACSPVVPPSFPIAGYANAAVWSIPVLRQRGVKAAARKLRWLTHPTFPAKWVPAGNSFLYVSGGHLSHRLVQDNARCHSRVEGFYLVCQGNRNDGSG